MKIQKILVTTNIVTTILLFLLSANVKAQDSIPYEIQGLEEVSISFKAGFTKDDFIRMVQNDTSFYRAFKNLKVYSHQSVSKVQVYDKKGGEKAKMYRTAKHISNFRNGYIKILEEKTEGKFYDKKGNYNYFTAEMYDRVFFQKDTFQANNTVGEKYTQEKPQSSNKTEKYYEQLKTFMFSPGTGVDGVPIIGNKLNIFEGKMMQYYDYTIEKKYFQDSIPCYVFDIKMKEGINPEKVVIKKLTTYFDRRTMNIIARTYSLSQKTSLFDFNIQMYIQLTRKYNEYLPVIIRYNGSWDVPFKKPENISFEMKCEGY